MVKKSGKNKVKKRVCRLSRFDVKILNTLKGNEPIGMRVKLLRNLLNLKQGHTYKRLKRLQKLGLVINNFPLWRINTKNFKEINMLKKGGEIYVDFNKKSFINLKKEHCYFCGYNKVLDYHHIIPKSKGGKDYASNKMILCPNCHTFLHRNNLKLIKFGRFWIMVDKNNKPLMFPFNK